MLRKCRLFLARGYTFARACVHTHGTQLHSNVSEKVFVFINGKLVVVTMFYTKGNLGNISVKV